MTISKRTENMYEHIIKQEKGFITLSDEELLSFGYDKNSIKTLVDSGIIYFENGIHVFGDTEGLYAYGRGLYSRGDFYKANLTFKKVLELNPYHYEALLENFYKEFVTRNYTAAVPLFERLYRLKWVENPSFWDFILYLASFSLPLNVDLKNRAKNITLQDLQSQKENYMLRAYLNKIKFKAIQQHWAYSIKILNDYTRVQGSTRELDLVLYLLKSAYQARSTFKKRLGDFLQQADWRGMYSFIKKEEINHQIADYYLSIATVAKDLVNIKERRITRPTVPIIDRDNVTIYEAIECYDYPLARELAKKFEPTKEESKYTNSLIDIMVSLMYKELKSLQARNNTKGQESTFDDKKAIEIQEILDFLSKRLAIDESYKVLSLDAETRDLVIVNLAKKAYSKGFTELGDRYLNLLGEIDLKSDDVKAQIRETQRLRKDDSKAFVYLPKKQGNE